jgi:ATP-dependent protease Clp ATPase subunit
MHLHEELQMSRATAHGQVSCSFCGKSQNEVRSLIEGGCRNPALSQCVFICDECITFSAQVIAGRDANAKAVQESAKPLP